MKYPLVRLKPKEGRRLRAGAPWAFSNEVAMTPNTRALAPGSLVNLAGEDGREFGTGYFNPKSLIAVRLLAPIPDAEVGADFFRRQMARALAIREALFDAPYYRLVHAEGDELPGLTIDRFADLAVAQITTAGMELLTEAMVEGLKAATGASHILLRNDSPPRTLEGLNAYVRWAAGGAGRIAVEENGVRYFADPAGGQKTGWYFDQRDNRAFMAGFAKNRTVLDAYCYTGGFALAAARAGARAVTGIDSSQPALALAQEAAEANGVSDLCTFAKADVFEELGRRSAGGDRFDIVIADPPPFVRARKDLEAGARAYRKLARLCAAVVAPGGFLFLASCSHNIPMERLAAECAIGIARAGRTARLIRQAGAGPDHPVHPMLPETAYLKALVYALD